MDDNHDDTSRHDAPRRDDSKFTVTAEEASLLFAEAGVPRSVRSVQRFCQKGHLTCILVDTEMTEMYLIDRNSIERRIKELQQIQQAMGSTGDATGRGTPRQDASSRDTARHDEPREQQGAERIKELENEIENSRLDARINRELANYVKDQNKGLIEQLGNYRQQIGSLETQLKALHAPRETLEGAVYADVEEIPAEEGDNSISANEDGAV